MTAINHASFLKPGKLVAVLLVGLPFLALGQIPSSTPALKTYDRGAIYLNATFWGTRYIKDSRSYPVGLGFRKLKRELEFSPMALEEFGRFRRSRRTSTLLTVAGLAGWFVAPSLIATNEDAAVTAFLGGTVLVFASIPINFQGNNRLAKSVWLHNRRVLSIN